MRALGLDYIATGRTHQIGAVLLVVGVLLVTFALLQYRSVHNQVSAHQSALAEIRKTEKRAQENAPGSPRDLDGIAHEVTLAKQALQRLALPWDDLFLALESTPVNGIALLAIEPDSDKNTVKLTAEAKSAEDMLDYVVRLQAVVGLADVTLANHQIKQNDPLRLLRFAVVASWVKQP